jgi:hypothetical protein
MCVIKKPQYRGQGSNMGSSAIGGGRSTIHKIVAVLKSNLAKNHSNYILIINVISSPLPRFVIYMVYICDVSLCPKLPYSLQGCQ